MKDTENLKGVFKSRGKIFKDKVECFGISCDLKGDITEILYDGLNIQDYIITKKSFLNLVVEGSSDKANDFMEKEREIIIVQYRVCCQISFNCNFHISAAKNSSVGGRLSLSMPSPSSFFSLEI